MLLFGLGFLAVALMILCIIFKRPSFGFGAAAMWFLMAIDCYTLAAAGFTVWDIYALFSLACFGMMIVSVMEAMAVRTKKEEVIEDGIDRQIAKQEAYKNKMDRYNQLTGGQSKNPNWYDKMDKKYSK